MADPRDAGTAGSGRASEADRGRRVFSVGDLLRGLRALLEDRVGRIWVAGEISNHFASGGGHQYFTLKDPDGQIRCAFFRGDARKLRFDLENGLEVLVHAEATVYEARGELQLVVRQVEPRGAGALQLAFDQLRRSLESEGLFDDARKRALPAMPRRVGVVTSDRGAALHDVIQVSGSRFPAAPLLLSPTRVQGQGADLEILAALERVAVAPDVDVVLLVRGGGSLEDLWSFNSEPLVRAIAACPVPVIVGVGHETDFTLADFAADFRAPTPSAAAMSALPDRRALLGGVRALAERLEDAACDRVDLRKQRLRAATNALRVLAPSQRLAARRARLGAAARALRRALDGEIGDRRSRHSAAADGLVAARPRFAPARDRVRAAARALGRATQGATGRRRARFVALAAQLDSLSPLAVLSRGYAVVRRQVDGRVVREVADVAPGDSLSLRVARATIRAAVESAEPCDEDA